MFQEIIDENLPLQSTHPEATRIHAQMLEIEFEISKLQERYQHLSSQLRCTSSRRQNLPELNFDHNKTFPRIKSQNFLKSNLPEPPSCKENYDFKSNQSCNGYEDTVFWSYEDGAEFNATQSPLSSPTHSVSSVEEQTMPPSPPTPSYKRSSLRMRNHNANYRSISRSNSPESRHNAENCTEKRRYRQSSPSSGYRRGFRNKSPDKERRTDQSNPCDTAVELLLIQRLIQEPRGPLFDGNPLRFNLWFNELNRQIEKLNAQPMDAVLIFRSNTVGEPKELIERLMSNGNDSSKRILKRITKELEERFGNSRDISRNIREKLQNLPTIYDSDSAETYFDKLRKISETCIDAANARRKAKSLRVLDCPDEIDKIRIKLPRDLNEQWRRKKYRLLQKYGEEPRFSEFSEFLEKETQILWTDRHFKSCLPSGPTINSVKSQFKSLVRGFKRHFPPKPNQFCVLHNSVHHDIKWCVRYKKLEDIEKWFVRRRYGLCNLCLKNHDGKACSNLT